MGEIIRPGTVTVSRSDLKLIQDGLNAATKFFIARDEMNSFVHLADIRYSPITEQVAQEWDRVTKLLEINA